MYVIFQLIFSLFFCFLFFLLLFIFIYILFLFLGFDLPFFFFIFGNNTGDGLPPGTGWIVIAIILTIFIRDIFFPLTEDNKTKKVKEVKEDSLEQQPVDLGVEASVNSKGGTGGTFTCPLELEPWGWVVNIGGSFCIFLCCVLFTMAYIILKPQGFKLFFKFFFRAFLFLMLLCFLWSVFYFIWV